MQMRGRVILLLVIIVLIFPAQAILAQDTILEGYIAYISNVTDTREIWIVNATWAVDPVQLTNLGSVGLNPIDLGWGPNGDSITLSACNDFDGTCQIYVLDMGTGLLEQITFGENEYFGPTFSPDEEQIAFTSWEDDHYDLMVMNADGSHLVNVTDFSGEESILYLNWSDLLYGYVDFSGSGATSICSLPTVPGFMGGVCPVSDVTGSYQFDVSEDGQFVFATFRGSDTTTYVTYGMESPVDSIGSFYFPSWDPSGEYLAGILDYQVVIRYPNGDLRTVVSDIYNYTPDWSPAEATFSLNAFRTPVVPTGGFRS